ncbi:MAG TPA: ATP-binding protein [Ktedonobacterales bacterium]|nr:ATP-binding protein [Ktedonobacterales bacterium]
MNTLPNASRTPRRRPHDDGVHGAPHEVGASYAPPPAQMIGLHSLAALASRMSDGVCGLTADERIWYANPALRALLGRSEAELLGKRIDEFRRVTATISDGRPEGNGAPSELGALSAPVRICQWRRSDGVVFEARCAREPLAIGGEPGGSILLVTPFPSAPDSVSQEEGAARARQVQQAERAVASRWVQVIEVVTDATLIHLPAHDLIEAMLNRIRPALGLENAAVFLINEAGDALEARALAGAGREFARAMRLPLDGSVVGGVLRSRTPAVVNGAEAVMRESGLLPERLLASMIVHSMLLTPLLIEDQVIGLLYLGARAENHFTTDDIRLARVAGARVAQAVEGARAHEAEARAREEATRAQRRLVLLAEASEALVGPLDHTEIATRLVSLIAPAFATACALYLVEDDGIIRRVAASGLPAGEDSGLATLAQASVARALPMLPREIESFEALRLSGQAGGQPGTEPVIIARVPVEAHGHPLGALYLIEGTQRSLAPEDLTLIQGLTRRAAVGMEIARLYAELEQALKRVSETAIQLDTIFDSTDAGIYVTDANGRYLRINTYGLRMLGLSEGPGGRAPGQARVTYELRDERGNLLAPEDDPLYIARTRNEPVERRVIIHRFDTGLDIPALARWTPMRDGRGKVIGAVGALMDITDIHEIERQKDEFLGIVSHELKTPLTTLKILSQMLARRMRASDEPRAQEQAERMNAAILRMERLINDLLDVSRIQEGRLKLTMTVSDLGAICRDAAREQEFTTQRVIHLLLPDRESLPVHADIERLRQVVDNLLSNALKYSPPTMPVTLEVREAGDHYLVSVADHGPGLRPDERRRLFQRFYRAPSVQVQSGSGVGLGLGLFISQEIVVNHGGSIWVESEPGQGAVFTFSIPRAGNSAAGQASGAPPAVRAE